MKIGNFKTDKNKEASGVWIEAGEGLELRIARHNNPNYLKMIQKLGKGKSRVITSGINPDLVLGMTKKAASSTILLDWKNLQDEEGKDISYSNKKCLELFNDFPEFFEMVISFASDVELYREDGFGEREGNSDQSLDGN